MKFLIPLLILLYLLSPIDLLPDFFGPIGRLDDLALIAYVGYRYLKNKKLIDENTTHYDTENKQRTETKQSVKKPPHEILSIPADADKERIEQAYKELSKQYHPDKVQHLGEDLQKLAHEKMVEITAAYQELKKNS